MIGYYGSIRLALLCTATSLLAWNPPVDTAGPLTVTLRVPSTLQSLAPFPGSMVVINDSSRDIDGQYQLRGIDGWTIAPSQAQLHAPAQTQIVIKFVITPAERTYAAHYPVHAYVHFEQDAVKYTAHPIAIIETKVARVPPVGAGYGGGVFDAPSAKPGALGRIGPWEVVLTTARHVLFRGLGAELSFELPATHAAVTMEGGAVRIHLLSDPGPEAVGVGRWSKEALRVYAGQGNVIDHPAAFNLPADGHREATSYVAFDFPGISILQATDVPPDHLEVNPAERICTLTARHIQTISLIPAANVWTAALHWREIDGQNAAPGVPKLAGRFVFDLWDGTFADAAAQLRRAFRYGLTDSLVIWHVWQRWGYDYRLPDIWPPDPDVGTADEFKALAQLCKDNGVLFAPHDNYNDFYPDADGFTYSKIAMLKPGAEPWPAWFHRERNAQSYRWLGDSFRPFLERNVRLLRDNIAPTAYFIDVMSSIEPFDQWSADAKLVSASDNRRYWGEAFAWVRRFLGNDAPTISEAGHDALIGWLDGATSVHLRVAEPPQRGMVWSIHAADSERIPWMDAVNHDRFVQHGAGYEDRYAEGLDRREHGIYSDDYITTEVMTGHPAMVSEAFGRDAVRVYWLLHDLGRALAMQHITGFEFAGGNLHRQHVTWSNGEVWVNRGAEDWTVAGHTLPQYGYYARAGGVESAIERSGSQTVRWSKSASGWYRDDYRIDRDDSSVRVTPLPGSARMDIRLEWSALPWSMPEPHTVESLNEDGRVLETDPVRRDGAAILLTTNPNRFAYRLR
ncbi:MAG TPA: DUF5696 domain-containing protein [Bryobacteraceae bacterium]|nr:DUF5696 domain-containing protein [Bryobacteraceae bacterium]